MPNGKRGDHPITDIIYHNDHNYSPELRQLIKDCYELSNRNVSVFDRINFFEIGDKDELKRKLEGLKKELDW